MLNDITPPFSLVHRPRRTNFAGDSPFSASSGRGNGTSGGGFNGAPLEHHSLFRGDSPAMPLGCPRTRALMRAGSKLQRVASNGTLPTLARVHSTTAQESALGSSP